MTSKLEIVADLSIPMRFDGPQPNAFGVEPAVSAACEYGDLVGDTRRGGSCNFERVTFIPHCNGTHTECIGHLTHERIAVRDCLRDVVVPALLVSVNGTRAEKGDVQITTSELMSAGVGRQTDAKALIVRTLPNDDSKLGRAYDTAHMPPYFSRDAIELIVISGYTHLLTDLPSIDRLDDPQLLNHCVFWHIEPGTHTIHTASRIYSTITELIYVPNDVPDGEYRLNLQIAPFQADAAPSRPVLLAPDP